MNIFTGVTLTNHQEKAFPERQKWYSEKVNDCISRARKNPSVNQSRLRYKLYNNIKTIIVRVIKGSNPFSYIIAIGVTCILIFVK